MDNLIKLGVEIESITTDGHKSILKAIKKIIAKCNSPTLPGAYPKNVFSVDDRFPKHLAGVELRQLVLLLPRIKTDNDTEFIGVKN